MYAQYSTGYKSGGFGSTGCDDPFEPEELNAAEVGFKSELAGGRTRLNGSLFYYDYSDLQMVEAIGTALNVNNADAEIWGLDLDVLYAATDALTLNAGIALLDTEYTEFSNLDTVLNPPSPSVDLSGNPLTRAPEWTVVVGAQYEWVLASGGTVFLRGDAFFSDSYQTREFNEPGDEQQEYHNLNAVINYTSADDSWSVGVWAKNLTDEVVLQNVVDTSPLTTQGPGWRGGTFNLPRPYDANVEYRFYRCKKIERCS